MRYKTAIEKERDVKFMYRKPLGGWLKHWDFMLLDLLFLQISYVFAYIFRNGLKNPYEIQIYLNIAIVICLIDICIVFFSESYSGIMRRGYLQEFKAVFKHVCAISVVEAVYLFLNKNGEEFSRISFLTFAIISIILLYLERVLWKKYLFRHRTVTYKKKALLILTTSDKAKSVVERLKTDYFQQLIIIGIVLIDRDDLAGEQIGDAQVVCRKDEILDYVRTKWVDGVFIDIEKDAAVSEHLKNTLLSMGVAIHVAVAKMEKGIDDQMLDSMGDYVVLSTVIKAAPARELFLKRFMDIVGGIAGLLLTAFLTVIIGPAIYISSPGPIFFSQIRVGKNGRRFKIYKFRSMYLDAEEKKESLQEKNKMKGLMFKVDADPRIIGSGPDGKKHGIGWLIRKTSIDEFPQFLNVLKGDMSLVGTRPPTVDEWNQYEYHHRVRMAIKPGLTGLWQVSGRSNITDFEEVVKLDLNYIQNWSLELDIKILLKTIGVVLIGRGSE